MLGTSLFTLGEIRRWCSPEAELDRRFATGVSSSAWKRFFANCAKRGFRLGASLGVDKTATFLKQALVKS